MSVPSEPDPAPMEAAPAALLEAVSVSVAPWIRAHLVRLAADRMTNDAIDALAVQVADRAIDDLRALLSTDVDAQRANPLHVLRSAAGVATVALRSAGVPPVPRDAVETEAMPDDDYAIGPLTWRDLSEEVHEAGITWGAWKAATIISRRRAEGRT